MRRALVVGASGGMGASLTKELAERGIEVVAFARNGKKLESLHGCNPLVTIAAGDAFERETLLRAARRTDVIFHCASVPYPEWAQKHPLLMANVLAAAREAGAKVVIVDNIYAYGKNPGHKVSENQPKRPHTKKGQIRLQMEEMAKKAHAEGIPCLIAHFPDFYGPFCGNTYLYVTLEPIVRGRRGIFVGDLDVPREYIFTPDGAKALVELSLRDDAYGENWNIPGYGVITGREILRIAENLLGTRVRVTSVGRTALFVAGWFNPFLREVREMLYLTEDPVVLDGAKYEREIGTLPRTPYEEGIAETIRHLQQKG